MSEPILDYEQTLATMYTHIAGDGVNNWQILKRERIAGEEWKGSVKYYIVPSLSSSTFIKKPEWVVVYNAKDDTYLPEGLESMPHLNTNLLTLSDTLEEFIQILSSTASYTKLYTFASGFKPDLV